MFLFFFFFSLPQAVLDKKYIYRKFKSSHLAKAMFKEQELSVTLTKIPKIGAIMQGKVSSYFFSFPLLFFFPQEWPFTMYLFIQFILHVPGWGWLGTFFRGSIRQCLKALPPLLFPAAFLFCLPLCLFGYAQAPVCLGWGNRAVV